MQVRQLDGQIIEINLDGDAPQRTGPAHPQITWQVGELIRFDPADPEFASLEAAIALARTESERSDKRVYGVWTGQDHGSELVAIVHQGEIFRK
jgi:hypothetical protein